MADVGDVVSFAPSRGVIPPEPETSFIGDVGRSLKAGFLDAAAGLVGVGELISDRSWLGDWSADNAELLRQAAKETRSRMDPARQRMAESEIISEPGSGRASFWSDPLKSSILKLSGMLGSTVPSVVGGLAAGPPGFIAGTVTEGGMSAGGVYGDIKDKINGASETDLMKVPLYQRMRDDFGLSDAAARQVLIRDGAKHALTAGVIATALGLVGEKGGAAVGRKLVGREIEEVGGTVAQRVIAGGTREAGQEIGQQTGEIVGRVGGGVGPTSWQDFLNQIIESGVGGFALGGGITGAAGRRSQPEAVPGKAPDASQKLALETRGQQAPPAPPSGVIPSEPTGPGIEDIPTGAPGFGAPDYPVQGWTAQPPAGPTADDVPTGAPGLGGADTTGGGVGVIPSAPQNVPAPAAQPGSQPAALGAPNVDPITETQTGLAALPPEGKRQIQQLVAALQVAKDVPTRQEIARQIQAALDAYGVPVPWGPRPTAAPTMQGVGQDLVRAAPPEMSPGVAPPGVIPPQPAGQVGQQVALQGEPFTPSAPRAAPTQIPPLTPRAVPTAAREKLRGSKGASAAEMKAAVKEAFAATAQNELAGTTAVQLNPSGIDALVDEIIGHAQREGQRAGGPALGVAALVDSMQAVAGTIVGQPTGTGRVTGAEPGAVQGDLQIGVDRQGRPVRLRDLLLGAAQQLQGGPVLNPVAFTTGQLTGQEFSPLTATKSGQATYPEARPPSAREQRVVEKLAAPALAVKETPQGRVAKGGVVETARAFAAADDTQRTEALDTMREFMGALKRALADRPETPAVANANRRLGEAQTNLDKLRDVVWHETTPARVRGVAAALTYAMATTRQIAPDAAKRLQDALVSGDLQRVVSTLNAIQDAATTEIRARYEKPEPPRQLPTGKTGAYRGEAVPKETGTAHRFERVAAALTQPVRPPTPPVVLVKPDLPEPAGGKPKIAVAPKEKPGKPPSESRQETVQKIKEGAKVGTVLDQLQALTPDQMAAVAATLPDAVHGNTAATFDTLKNFGISDPRVATDMLVEAAHAQVQAGAAPAAEPGQEGRPAAPLAGPSQPGVQAPAGRRRRARERAGPAAPDVGTAADQRGAVRPGGEGGREGTGRPVAGAAGRGAGKPAVVTLDESLLPQVERSASKGWDSVLRLLQQEGVDHAMHAYEQGRPAFALADGTGVGKTRQELALAVEGARHTGLPSLIVTENDKIATNMARDLTRMGVPPDERPEITTYSQLARGNVSMKPRGFLIFDESHNLKNATTAKSLASLRIPHKFAIYASATPWDTVVGSAQMIARLTAQPLGQVAQRLGFTVTMMNDKPVVTPLPGMTGPEIKRRIALERDQLARDGAFIRRVQAFWGDVRPHVVAPATGQLDNERVIADYWDEQKEGQPPGVRAGMEGQKIGEQRRYSEALKLPDVQRQIDEALKAGKSVVVVAEGVNETDVKGLGVALPGTLNHLSDWARQRRIDHARIFGNRSSKQAKYDADRFLDNKVQLALMTPGSGGTGIDLDDQAGGRPRLMIVMTPSYAADKFEQVLGRISRSETQSASEVRLLQTPGSIADAHGMKVLAEKLANLHAGQQGADVSQSKLEEDLRRLDAAKDRHLALRSGDVFEMIGPTGISTPELDRKLSSLFGEKLSLPSSRDVLRTVADLFPSEFQPIVRYLAAHGPDVKVERFSSHMSASALGTYSPSNDVIQVDLQKIADRPDWSAGLVLLHETIHAATVRAIRSLKGDDRVKLLDVVFHQIRDTLRERRETAYAATDRTELLAEAFSNPRVQDMLRATRMPVDVARRIESATKPAAPMFDQIVTMWDAVVAWVRDIVGLPSSERSALDSVLRLGASFIEHDRVARSGGVDVAENPDDRLEESLQGREHAAHTLTQGLLESTGVTKPGGATSLGTILPQIAASFDDPALRALAMRVATLAPDTLVVSMETYNQIMPERRAAGVHASAPFDKLTQGVRRAGSFRSLVVGIDPQTHATAEVLLHEAVHAATQQALRRDREAGGSTSLALDRVVEKLQQLGWPNESPRLRNAALNVDELLAEAFTSVQVQEALKTVQLDPTTYRGLVQTAWDFVVNAIRRLIGATVHNDALSGVLQAGTRLMEQDLRFRQRAGDITEDEAVVMLASLSQLKETRTQVATAMRMGGNPGPAASVGHAGILDDAAGRKGGVAANLLASRRSLSRAVEVGALASSSLDTIKEWRGRLLPGLAEHQKMGERRTERISKLIDDKKMTRYGGKSLTSKGFFDTWTNLANAAPDVANSFDRLVSRSTQQQIHLDRPLEPGARARRRIMWEGLQDDWKALPQAWKDLYKATRLYYQMTNRLSRDTLLSRLKGDIQAANPNVDISRIKFGDLKAVRAATKTGTLTDRHRQRIMDIHAVYSRLSFYAPERRRGDFVVRANINVDGEFDRATAQQIIEAIPDRRLQATFLPNGNVELRVRPSDAPDPTDPAVRAGGPAGQGDPLPIYERFENRGDAERRIKWLQNQAQAWASRKGAGRIEMTVRSLDRQKQDPTQIEHADPTISRQAQAELSRRIESAVQDTEDRTRLKRLVAEVTAGLQPDTYISKNRIQRRFIAGASQDHLRALGEHITAFAHNLAHLEHDREIENHLLAMKKDIVDDTKFAKGADREKARLAMREIEAREDAQLDRAHPAGWVNAATGVTYFYMLTSASYSVLQALQPTMVGLPLLAAKYGTARSMAALTRASWMFRLGTTSQGALRTFQTLLGRQGANVFDYEPVLEQALKNQPDGARLLKGLKYARDIGVSDLSFSREITEARTLPSAHRGERSAGQHLTKAGQWAMDWSRMLPHAIEVGNRAMVFTAAYRLDYARTQDHDKAVAAGIDAIRKSQIDYSTGNKPRILQSKFGGGVARIPLMFKQYALHMYSLFAINAMQAIKGETRQDRIAGAKALAGLLSTHALAAGAAGVVLEPIKIAIFLAASMLGGDDEEKFDLDRWMHQGLREIFGDTLGEAAYGGVPRLLGADISQRVGLQNLLLFSTLDDLANNKSAYEIVGSTFLGPTGSLVVKGIPDAFNAFARGDTAKGFEALTPKFARDAIKAYRYDQEGILDKHGNQIGKTVDVDAGLLAAQVLGFRPTQVSNLFEARDAIIDKKEFIENRTNHLMEQWWRARTDSAARAEVRAEIQAFNRLNPRERITSERLAQSMRTRREHERKSQFGVYLPDRQKYIGREAAYLR